MKRKSISVTIVVAVALFTTLVVTRTGWLEPALALETLRIETVLSVDDDGLTELAVGEGSLWSLNAEKGIVYEVKPGTNELGRVLATDPDSSQLAVADERAWTVGHRKGFVTTTPLTGAPDDLRRFTVIPVGDNDIRRRSLRLHAAAEKVWVSAGVDRPVIALDATSVRGYPPATAASSLTNLSAIGGDAHTVWGVTLDGRAVRLSSEGDVTWDQRVPDEQHIRKAVADGNGVWLLDADRVLRIDSETGTVRTIDFDAIDIAVGDGLLWVIGEHRVEVYNSVTAHRLGSITIEQPLLGVEHLAHSGWVLGAGGKIFRISMNDAPLELRHPLEDDRLAYAYSSDGDLWAEQVDGDDVNLVVSEEKDRRPSISPDGTTIAFQRDQGISGGVYFLDLSNGEERFLGHGGWPTYGHSDDAFAYVSRGHGVYGINFVRGRRSTFVGTGANPSYLSWAEGDRALYFVAGDEFDRMPYRITIGRDGTPSAPERIQPSNGRPGANYPIATIGSGARVFAVRECCRLPQAELIYEFGYIDMASVGRPFVPLLELTETGIGEPIALVAVGTLVPPSLGDPQTWTQTEPDGEPSWLLSDGYTLTYLFHEGAEWSHADERLEHPGRAEFDGFSVATTGLKDALPDAPPMARTEMDVPRPTSSPVGPSPTKKGAPSSSGD
ncbi:MAG TPA: hypothetical protein VIG64_08885 [Actinomycetota bacterium]|jgi:hypothetical protein